jgi:hypothetical protein
MNWRSPSRSTSLRLDQAADDPFAVEQLRDAGAADVQRDPHVAGQFIQCALDPRDRRVAPGAALLLRGI